jgi:hypothetical protein
LSTPKKEYTSLEAALSLCAGLAPDEVVRLLTARATLLRMEIGAVESGLAYTTEIGLPELFVIEEQYRRAMMQAELAFVAQLAERIDSNDLGGTSGWRRLHELADQGITFEQVAQDPERHLGEEGRALAPFLRTG